MHKTGIRRPCFYRSHRNMTTALTHHRAFINPWHVSSKTNLTKQKVTSFRRNICHQPRWFGWYNSLLAGDGMFANKNKIHFSRKSFCTGCWSLYAPPTTSITLLSAREQFVSIAAETYPRKRAISIREANYLSWFFSTIITKHHQQHGKVLENNSSKCKFAIFCREEEVNSSRLTSTGPLYSGWGAINMLVHLLSLFLCAAAVFCVLSVHNGV